MERTVIFKLTRENREIDGGAFVDMEKYYHEAHQAKSAAQKDHGKVLLRWESAKGGWSSVMERILTPAIQYHIKKIKLERVNG